MGRFFYTNKLHIVHAIFFLLLLLVNGSAWADDNCPTLETKTLLLCNPTEEEVAENLGTPVTLINGERAEGYLTLDKDFYYTKNTTEYTAIWTFKNDEGTVLADGCEQKFYVQDKESPVAGEKTLTVYGYSPVGTGWLLGSDLKSQVKNQPITWSDNCTTGDSIIVEYDFKGLGDNEKLTGGTKSVDIKLTDRNGNVAAIYTQSVKIEIKDEHICTNIKDVYLTISKCDISCEDFKSQVQLKSKANAPKMDGLVEGSGTPEEENNAYILYNAPSSDWNAIWDNVSRYNCDGNGSVKPGEYVIYLRFRQLYNDGSHEWWHKYCPQKVIVKDAGTPPECPKLETMGKDATSLSASDIAELITDKVHSYTEKQLDNCSPNKSLSVTYTSSALSAPYCGEVTYYLSDYSTKRSCKATIVLPDCPSLPDLQAKFCNNSNSMPKSDLITFLKANKPNLDCCAGTIAGSLDESSLKKHTYNSYSSTDVSWNFIKDGVTFKTCTQKVYIYRSDVSCADFVFEKNVETDCDVSGTEIPLPVITACNNSGHSISWGSQQYQYKYSASDLKNYRFSNGDVIYWNIDYQAQCKTTIKIIDNNAPVCLSPSLGTLSGKCVFDRTDVEKKMANLTLDDMGSDICGLHSYAIDWDKTAYREFSLAGDGSDKTYSIYYKIKDNNGLENADYCKASITVSCNVKCPDESLAFLSEDTSVALTLDNNSSWTLKETEPSGITLSSGTLSNLSFNKDNKITLSATTCGKKVTTCKSTIMLIKPATPCTTK